MTTKRNELLATLNNEMRVDNVEHIDITKFNGTNGALQARIDEIRNARNTTRRRVLSNDKQISAVDIAKSLNINPKIARAKLRRAYARDVENALPQSLSNDNWVFAREHENVIKDLLTA